MPQCSNTADPLQRSSSLRSRRDASSPSTLNCCCGRIECAFLKKNCSILETVEKDVHTAAQLGQALLVRHEAYMADAERDRLELTARIERLESDKHNLEAVNAATVEENRVLLDQLEALNNTISDSDTKIKALEACLLSSQQNVRRLESAAARAADAERHIALLEQEQDKLHRELLSTKDDARTHAQRFKEAQRGILDMQDQLERMEQEARQERERHAEVVDRMERQREIDKQLDIAAGRLKGAAGTKNLQEHRNGTKIVGHFVRDLLEDNANLQLGIAELREMLINSNDEIQSLRDQLVHHQPISADETTTPVRNLEAELGAMSRSPRLSQELHIHHHYHVATPKKVEAKKPRKKRQGALPSGFSTPTASTPASSRPSTSLWGPACSSAAPALLTPVNGDATPTPTPSRPRQSWGGLSQAASDFSSSLPGSPPSNRGSTVFDSSFGDPEPVTSPTTSFDPLSPTWRASNSKRSSGSSTRSYQSMSLSLLDHVPNTPSGRQLALDALPENTIQEEDEDDVTSLQEPGRPPELVVENSHFDHGSTDHSDYHKQDLPRHPRLMRATSHESIMSLAGGLDIHTLKSRPSQMALRPLGGGADAVVTGVTARPTISSTGGKRSDMALRDHFAGFSSPRTVSRPNSPVPTPGSSPMTAGSRPVGRWAGWRPWGGVGTRHTPSRTSAKQTDKDKGKDPDKDANRVPGINQPGAIPGFQQYWAAQKRKGAPAQVTAESVDRDALTEVLQE
ncbi:hypothetical protein HIM_08103 [Hirsutella minnesotensis 3608]|uniref:Uncharacterized protein n=1 Tax=Hirsutella minnesotensis 3608 TaxID=1043627 RepID=A0A0F8A3U4_9HYPO|nr:hypothetical protein HIM_08103 [Hirsutella minnesotensis 3608]